MTTSTLEPDDILASFLSWDEIARKVQSSGSHQSVYRRGLEHPDARIRRLAYLRFPTDSGLMTAAATDANNEVRQVAAASRATPPMVLATFMDDRSRVVRELLVQNPAAPDFVREHLVSDPTPEVRTLVASSPLSITALERLSHDTHSRVRYRLARRRDLPPGVIITLANDSAAEVRREVAARRAPDPVFERLANDPDPSVVKAVAGNRNAPQHVARLLVSHPDRCVRLALARRTEQPAILDLLADDPELAVREAACLNPVLTTEAAVRMLHSPSAALRRALLDQHLDRLPASLVATVLDQLLSQARADVRRTARRTYPDRITPRTVTSPPALNDRRGLFEVVDQRLPFELIAHAVAEESLPPTVRAGLLMHPDTPDSVRKELRNHPNDHIRAAARTPRHNPTEGCSHS